MTVVSFSCSKQVLPSLVVKAAKISHLVSLGKDLSSINEKSCRLFTTPGLTLSSKDENYVVLLFLEPLFINAF